jgi:hypothetical protein
MKTINFQNPEFAAISTSEGRAIALIHCPVGVNDITSQIEDAIQEFASVEKAELKDNLILDKLDPVTFKCCTVDDDGEKQMDEYTIEILPVY